MADRHHADRQWEGSCPLLVEQGDVRRQARFLRQSPIRARIVLASRLVRVRFMRPRRLRAVRHHEFAYSLERSRSRRDQRRCVLQEPAIERQHVVVGLVPFGPFAPGIDDSALAFLRVSSSLAISSQWLPTFLAHRSVAATTTEVFNPNRMGSHRASQLPESTLRRRAPRRRERAQHTVARLLATWEQDQLVLCTA